MWWRMVMGAGLGIGTGFLAWLWWQTRNDDEGDDW
jgi:hypothetical protein